MTRRTLAFLSALAGVAAACAYMFGRRALPFGVTFAAKAGPTLLLMAWLLASRPAKDDRLLFWGFAFSLLCDVFMEFSGQAFLVAGIAANIVALVFYILFLVSIRRDMHALRLIPPAILLAAFFMAIQGALGAMRPAVLVYCVFYAAFLWRALALLGHDDVPLRTRAFALLGSVSITASDCVLALRLFGVIERRLPSSVLLMSLWWGGFLLLFLARARLRAPSGTSRARAGLSASERPARPAQDGVSRL